MLPYFLFKHHNQALSPEGLNRHMDKITENTMNHLTAPIDALHENQLLCICGIEAETQYRSVKARSLSFGNFAIWKHFGPKSLWTAALHYFSKRNIPLTPVPLLTEKNSKTHHPKSITFHERWLIKQIKWFHRLMTNSTQFVNYSFNIR